MPRPVILLSTTYVRRAARMQAAVNDGYFDCVSRAGGLPVLAPPVESPAEIRELLHLAGALLLVGGDDVDARRFGERNHARAKPVHARHDAFELALARAAVRRGVPLLGICRGCQVLNVALGGTLVQDIRSAIPRSLRHRRHSARRSARHPVSIEPGTLLARIVGEKRLAANSSHHQAVGRLGRGLVASAHASDGVVEAVESKRRGRFVLGVQWHPETLPRAKRHGALFRALVKAARTAR